MSKPINSGDRCEVIGGTLGKLSPNLGIIVIAQHRRGEHSVYGPIWRCRSDFIEKSQPGSNCPPGHADFAQSWLRRLDDPTQAKAQAIEKELIS